MIIERDARTGHFRSGPKEPTPRDPNTGHFLPPGASAEPAPTPEPESDTIRALRRENADLKKKNREQETLKGIVKLAIIEAVEDLPRIEIPRCNVKQKKMAHEEIACLHVSDTQIGKVTSTYNTEIAEKRLLELAERTIEITNMRRNAARITDIRVYLGGDIIEGEDIFPSQAHQIDQSVFDQAIRSAPMMLAKMILRLLEEFPTMTICTVPGNHGRNGRYGAGQHPRTNWDNVVYAMLNVMLLGYEGNRRKELLDRITFRESEDFFIVDMVYDWGNLMVHGDQITGGFGGFPYYGTAKKAWGWIDSIPSHWDYLYFGHFHTYAMGVLNRRIFLANGTTESDNTYAQAQLAAAGWPCQRLAFYNASKGLISDNQIYLDNERCPNKNRFLVNA